MRDKDSIKAKSEYDKLSIEELEDLGWTGIWLEDRKSFIFEWKMTQEIINDDKWNVIENTEDYGDF